MKVLHQDCSKLCSSEDFLFVHPSLTFVWCQLFTLLHSPLSVKPSYAPLLSPHPSFCWSKANYSAPTQDWNFKVN